MISKLAYKPPHYHKLEVPYLAGGGSWAKHYPKANFTPTHTYSNTPDFIYQPDTDMLLSLPTVSESSDITSMPTKYNKKLIVINKANLFNILFDAYNHDNSFNESSNETPSDSTEILGPTKNNSSKSHNSTSTESISSAPEYFTAEYGDTLCKIAKKYHTTVNAIVEANKDKPTERGFAQIKNKDLIYAGASYYLPSDAYIDTSDNNQNSTSSKDASQSTQNTTIQNDNDQFCLIGSENDPFRFFRSSEEINLAQKEFQKQNSQDIESYNDSRQSAPLVKFKFDFLFSDAIRPYFKFLTDETLNNLTDSDLIVNADSLFDLTKKLFNHEIELYSFELNSDTNIDTLAEAFGLSRSSVISSNPQLFDSETQGANNIIINKNSAITIPIEYNIREIISSLDETSQQITEELSVPTYGNIDHHIFTQYIQPYVDSSSLEQFSDKLSADDLISMFNIPNDFLYYLYEYIEDDPNISINDKFEFTPESNKLFQSINISSSINSSYADAYLDFHFISSPWLKKHLSPKVYHAFMYVINSFANGDYQHTHSAYTYLPRQEEDKSTVKISNLFTGESVPLDQFDIDRQNTIINRTFGEINPADTESEQPWDQYNADPDPIPWIQAHITYYQSLDDTEKVKYWQEILELFEDPNDT